VQGDRGKGGVGGVEERGGGKEELDGVVGGCVVRSSTGRKNDKNLSRAKLQAKGFDAELHWWKKEPSQGNLGLLR